MEGEPWSDDGWVDFALGVDTWAERICATFDAQAWEGEPGPEGPDDPLIDALLGLDLLARRVRALTDRCASAARAPSAAEREADSGGLLR